MCNQMEETGGPSRFHRFHVVTSRSSGAVLYYCADTQVSQDRTCRSYMEDDQSLPRVLLSFSFAPGISTIIGRNC